MNKQGFSLIELMVAIVFIFIIAMILLGTISGTTNKNVSIGINGISETRCIDGYKFIIGHGGQARQILNEQGGGIHCNQ